jgi:CRP-like cAMP-binding protein
MIDFLFERLNKLHPLSKELAEAIDSFIKVDHYDAGDFILREGEICKKASLVEIGLARSYYINDGRDITSRFMDEGFIITSWQSYYLQQPSNEIIEAMEPTTLISLDYFSIQKLYNEFPEFNIVGRKQTEYAFYLSEERTQMLRKHTAEEKYKFFLQKHPSILQRVPLKHIATYLGMNEETLSRVRSRYHKTN